jgi:hypothetical protein
MEQVAVVQSIVHNFIILQVFPLGPPDPHPLPSSRVFDHPATFPARVALHFFGP